MNLTQDAFVSAVQCTGRVRKQRRNHHLRPALEHRVADKPKPAPFHGGGSPTTVHRVGGAANGWQEGLSRLHAVAVTGTRQGNLTTGQGPLGAWSTQCERRRISTQVQVWPFITLNLTPYARTCATSHSTTSCGATSPARRSVAAAVAVRQ